MHIKPILQRLRSAIVDPREELSRWDRVIRYIWDLLRQGARQLSEDRASTMAASLTYRTLFGMLPVTVVGAGVARTIMGADRFETFMHNVINEAGLDDVMIKISDEGTTITIGQWLTEIVTSGMNVNVAAMTWIGLLVLIDRKSTRLNSSHVVISYAVFCLKKKKKREIKKLIKKKFY